MVAFGVSTFSFHPPQRDRSPRVLLAVGGSVCPRRKGGRGPGAPTWWCSAARGGGRALNPRQEFLPWDRERCRVLNSSPPRVSSERCSSFFGMYHMMCQLQGQRELRPGGASSPHFGIRDSETRALLCPHAPATCWSQIWRPLPQN